MTQIKRLQIFDLDDTLLRVPSYTSKKHVESLGYGFSGPYEYYDHPISLDEGINNIQLIEPVYEDWKNGKTDPQCMQILITHRVESLADVVKEVLKNRGIEFDQYFFLGRVTPKWETTREIVRSLSNLEEIEVYEDSVHQIAEYQEFFNRENNIRWLTQPHGSIPYFKTKICIVDKSKTYTIDNLRLSNEKKIRLI